MRVGRGTGALLSYGGGIALVIAALGFFVTQGNKHGKDSSETDG